MESQKAKLARISKSTVDAFNECEAFDPRVGAAYQSTYMSTNSSPLISAVSDSELCVVEVWNRDTVSACNELYTLYKDAERIGVLNMASEKNPGGGFMTGAPAQEEALCRCTTLYPCLSAKKKSFYPIPTAAVLVSPDVFVFRNSHVENYNFRAWSECYFVTGLSVAGLRHPPLVIDNATNSETYQRQSDFNIMTGKVKELLRAAHNSGCTVLVLGALGCGVFKNPPRVVARIFRDALRDEEFKHAFKRVVFAIIDSPMVTYGGMTTSNFQIFSEVIAAV